MEGKHPGDSWRFVDDFGGPRLANMKKHGSFLFRRFYRFTLRVCTFLLSHIQWRAMPVSLDIGFSIDVSLEEWNQWLISQVFGSLSYGWTPSLITWAIIHWMVCHVDVVDWWLVLPVEYTLINSDLIRDGRKLPYEPFSVSILPFCAILVIDLLNAQWHW